MTLIRMWAAFEGSIDADHNDVCPSRVGLPQTKMPSIVHSSDIGLIPTLYFHSLTLIFM